MAATSEIRLCAQWVAEATGGRIVSGDAAREFTGVSIDSRTVAAGELFVAIRGERFDGAEFVAAALAAGAAGVAVSGGRASSIAGEGAVVIEVDDTVLALQSLANRVRRESGAKVVAITGSAGKTTTKEIAAEFLAARYRVIRNRGNFNNHIGLPLSLIDLRTGPDIAVVELGMNHAGEISTLVGIAEPEVRVWTNVGEAHLGFFESIDAIADAKAEILERATADTVLVANADDQRIATRVPRFRGRLMTFGIDRPAMVQASAIVARGLAGTHAQVTTPQGTTDLEIPLVGTTNLANVLAATAVALEFGVPLEAIAATVRGLRPPAHRGEVLKLPGGVTILDDSYNANPTAMRKALDVLAGDASGLRRVAVLGEMLELGAQSTALHEDVGRAPALAPVDLLLTVGGAPAAALARAAVSAGLPESAVVYCETSIAAADEAAQRLRSGDVVLIKGSRGVRTDRVVDRLKAEFA